MGETILIQASLPKYLWLDIFATIASLINKLHTAILGGISLFKKPYKKRPKYLILRTFGYACYSHICHMASNKLSSCSLECHFLGYSPRHKGYHCFHIPIGQTFVLHHILFNEEFFSFIQKKLQVDYGPLYAIQGSPFVSSTFIAPLQPLCHLLVLLSYTKQLYLTLGFTFPRAYQQPLNIHSLHSPKTSPHRQHNTLP